ncbi:hypothetical protein K439DRAFT_1643769 [Ramaria rubella]|nr:hypothetical protein K439DRAFT_1643769 [Ramaria rubella]
MLIVMLSLSFLLPISANTLHTSSHSHSSGNISHYAHAHSYSSVYTFHKRDGWETVPVSDLSYKYVKPQVVHNITPAYDSRGKVERRSRAAKNQKDGSSAIGRTVQHVVDATLKGIGKIEQVTITWYTGKDLKNPSCWNKAIWAPSDESFACALTLEGWINRPKCFQFLELCNGPDKCVFVRVVDTCAGCAKGSKHVDLTKAAFEALASLDQGTLQVNMRLATNPKEWQENLWGPQIV